MIPTTERMKVEILFDAPLSEPVVAVVRRAGGAGHTLFAASGGEGRSGRWSEDQLSNADSKVLLMTVVTSEAAAGIVRELEALLDSHGMMIMVSRVGVVREDRF